MAVRKRHVLGHVILSPVHPVYALRQRRNVAQRGIALNEIVLYRTVRLRLVVFVDQVGHPLYGYRHHVVIGLNILLILLAIIGVVHHHRYLGNAGGIRVLLGIHMDKLHVHVVVIVYPFALEEVQPGPEPGVVGRSIQHPVGRSMGVGHQVNQLQEDVAARFGTH